MIAIGRHDKNDLSTEFCLVMAGCAALAFYSVFPRVWSSDRFGIGLLAATTASSLFLGWLAAQLWAFMMKRLVIPAVSASASAERHDSDPPGLPTLLGAPLRLIVAMGPWESFHYSMAVMLGTWPRRIKTFCVSLVIVVPSIVYGMKVGNLHLASFGSAGMVAVVMVGLAGVMGIALIACLAWAAGHWLKAEGPCH